MGVCSTLPPADCVPGEKPMAEPPPWARLCNVRGLMKVTTGRPPPGLHALGRGPVRKPCLSCPGGRGRPRDGASVAGVAGRPPSRARGALPNSTFLSR